jgi:hypothetical protein
LALRWGKTKFGFEYITGLLEYSFTP